MAFRWAFAMCARTALVVLLACPWCLQSPCGLTIARAAAADADATAPVAPSPAPPVPIAPPPAKLLEPVALDRDVATSPAPPRPASPPLVNWSVLGLIVAALGALAVLKVAGKRRAPGLPPDVFDVLGSASLGGQHSVRVVRFGPKTLLVSVSATGCQTLAELSDPQATACVSAACRGVHPPLRPRPTVQAAATRAGMALILALAAGAAQADEPPTTPDRPVAVATTEVAAPSPWNDMAARFLGTRSLDATLSAAIMFGVASLAPAVLLMTTSFVRMSVVLSLLRQGLGTQQLPSNQIVTSLAIFLSAMVMWPVWTQSYREGIEPYQQGRIELSQAYERGSLPIRRWMASQIEQAGNRDTMLLFLARHPAAPKDVKTYDDVPVETLLPAFLVSELKTAFSIGFRLILPFLVLDLVVATLVVATGLVMLPPTLVSLPLKLLVFVMADGWSLVVQSLLDSMRVTAT